MSLLSQLVADMDDKLFDNIQYNPHLTTYRPILHKRLPDNTDHIYNLRRNC